VLPASTAVRGGFSFAAAAAGVAGAAAASAAGFSAADAAAAARKAAVLARKAEMMAEAGDASDAEGEGEGSGMHAAGMMASPGGVGVYAASSGAMQTPSPQAPAASFGARGPSASRAGKKARIEPTTVAHHQHALPAAALAVASPSGAVWAPAGATSVGLDAGDAKWATHVWGSAAGAAKGGSFAEAVLGRKAAAPASSGSSAMETGADADEAAAAEGHAAVEQQGEEEDEGGFITVSAAGASKGECRGR
jgi:hypothetical protein